MGTRFHFDQMLPAVGAKGENEPDSQRQVEVFIPSGTREIHLRIGELNEEHQGRGYSVMLNNGDALALLEGIKSAMFSLGYETRA